jgi:hypothetical protein
MLGHRIFAAAAVALGLTFAANTAHAAPVLLTPDVNFVTHGPTFTITGKNDFNLSVDTSKGDFMAIDRGTGFSPITGTLTAMGSCDLVLTTGEFRMTAVDVSVKLTNSMVGKDLFAIYRVSSSTIPGFKAGSLIALDGLVYNIDKHGNGQIKGDVAPIVPEPASLSLLVLGLGAVAGAARRKLS